MTYYLKVWLFTVLASPILVVVGMVYQRPGSINDFFEALVRIWLLAVIFGSALALPALFLFRLLNKDLQGRKMPVLLKKIIHAIVGLMLLWLTFFVINRNIFEELSWDNSVWVLAYSLSLLIGALTYKMNDKRV